jgi:hypothetical protein
VRQGFGWGLVAGPVGRWDKGRTRFEDRVVIGVAPGARSPGRILDRRNGCCTPIVRDRNARRRPARACEWIVFFSLPLAPAGNRSVGPEPSRWPHGERVAIG